MLVSTKHKKLVLNLKDPERITTVIPTASVIDYKGKPLVVVPHRLDEVKVLRNMGLEPPHPMRYYYDWPGRKPFDHQRTTAEFAVTHPHCFILNGMGTGKTMSVLWAFDWLRREGMAKRLLVISPLSTLERTWADEVFNHFPHLTCAVLHGSRDKRHKLLAHDFDIYAINHDGFKNAETAELLAKREGIDVVVVDEIAEFRNASTDRWKMLRKVIDGKPYVWGMTGTPIPTEPTDAWAQCRLISPGRVPKYFSQFRDAVMKPISKFKWAPREGALTTVREAMQPAIRFRREDCIDLPPTTYTTRSVELTAEQGAAYKTMMAKLKAEYEGGQITAVNEAVKLSKLIQIGCGVAYGKEGADDIVLPAQPRIDAVRELIREADAKVIVFVPLTGALERLAEDLRQDFTVGVVHGATSKSQRDEVFHSFQNSNNPHVLVANPAAMSHGLTLTAASVICWFAPVTSNNVYEQANARIVRPGQTRNTLIAHIEATPADRKLYEKLQQRGKVQGTLLEMMKGENR